MVGQSHNHSSDNVGVLLSGNRPMPSRINAERALLGCLLLEPQSIPEAARVNFPTAFYHSSHQIIFDCLLDMDSKSQKIDLVTVSDYLEKNNNLEVIGGVAYLAELTSCIPTTANLENYINIVVNYGCLRAMIKKFCQGVEECYDDSKEAVEILDQVGKDITEIAGAQIKKEGVRLKEAMHEQMEKIIKVHRLKEKDPNALLGIPTGFKHIDMKMNGLKNGEIYVLAARPSMGKTTLAMNIAVNVALDDIPVGIFSLEMDSASLALRLMCAHSETSPNDIYGRVKGNAFSDFMNSSSLLSSIPLYIDDSNPLNILNIRARSRRLKQRYNVGLIVVDYLQIISTVSSNSRGDSREREVARISAGMKSLAKELQIPIIVLAQLNRSAERSSEDEKVEPGLEHLRESGSIEQDADVVMIIDGNRKQKNQASADLRSGDIVKQQAAKKLFDEGLNFNLIIAKNRNGETGPVRLKFFPQYTCFKNFPKTSKAENRYEKEAFDET